MKTTPALFRAYLLAQRARRLGTTLLAGTFVLAQVTPSLATIDNTATPSGTYAGNPIPPANVNSATQNVPVAAAAPNLLVTKAATVPTTGLGADTLIVDAGDQITYTYTVKNQGNVTMTGVVPTDPGPKFNNIAGTGTLAAFSPATATIAPGNQQVFTAVYTMSQVDVDRGAGIASGVTNTAGANGTTPLGVAYSTPVANQGSASTTIPAAPKLQITKSFSPAGPFSLGQVVTYTYTVKNSGNVAITNVSLTDMHGSPATAVTLGSVPYGADPAGITSETLASDGPLAPGSVSSDATLNNGIWSTLQPGATITLKFVHTVTQAEIDHG